jgi:hypothetical protein
VVRAAADSTHGGRPQHSGHRGWINQGAAA